MVVVINKRYAEWVEEKKRYNEWLGFLKDAINPNNKRNPERFENLYNFQKKHRVIYHSSFVHKLKGILQGLYDIEEQFNFNRGLDKTKTTYLSYLKKLGSLKDTVKPHEQIYYMLDTLHKNLLLDINIDSIPNIKASSTSARPDLPRAIKPVQPEDPPTKQKPDASRKRRTKPDAPRSQIQIHSKRRTEQDAHLSPGKISVLPSAMPPVPIQKSNAPQPQTVPNFKPAPKSKTKIQRRSVG